jgi:hypothetical protein
MAAKRNNTLELPVDQKFDLTPYINIVQYPFYIENDLTTLFCCINDAPYLVRTYSQCNEQEVLKWVFDLKVQKKNIFIRSHVLPFSDQKKIYRWYAWFQKDLLISIVGNGLSVYYSGHIPEKKMQNLFETIETRFKKEEYYNCIYYIDNFLNGDQKILRLSDKIIDPDILFNNDIKNFEGKITEILESDNATGLIILAGGPGNGQSTYLHYLTRVLRRRFLYLSKWDAPTYNLEMLDYLEYKSPLLVLEDADEYVKNTHIYEGSLGKFVKDLLNGKISKKIKQLPVILTLNYPFSHYPKLDQSDSTYIIAKYEFTPLETKKARSLITSLGKSLEISSPTTLYDIFHSND